MLKALSQKSMPEPVADSERVVAAGSAAPDLATATDDELLRFLHDYPPVFKQVFRNHMITTGTAAIVSGVLSDGATSSGRPGLVTELLGAADGVVSAQYSQDLWKVAQIVQRTPPSPPSSRPGSTASVNASPSSPPPKSSAPRSAHSSAGTATAARTTGSCRRARGRTRPSSPTRRSSACATAPTTCRRRRGSPATTPGARDAAAQVIPHLKLMDKANFRKALVAAPWWARAREATRDLAIRAHNPTRRSFFELARRAAERGGVDNLRDVAMLDPLTELPEYVADPKPWHDRIAERVALRDRFAAVEPPFFITSQAEVPSIEELERQRGGGRRASPSPVRC